MKSCCKCGKELSSGHIVCGDCKESTALPLDYFIDQLAEEIALDYKGMCDLCIRQHCDSQQSGLTCRNGIKAYLMSRVQDYKNRQRVSGKMTA